MLWNDCINLCVSDLMGMLPCRKRHWKSNRKKQRRLQRKLSTNRIKNRSHIQWERSLSKSFALIKGLKQAIRCHYTKSNPIDDHSNISSKKLQKQNFKPMGHYTCMQCGTSHLQKVQQNILSHIILATYRKFTVATLRFTQNVSCNIFTHPIY